MEILTINAFKAKVFDFDKGQQWKFEGQRPAIIDFYADWCGPCRALSPILEEVAKEYAGQVDVYKVSTESTPELAALFGVRGIPSLLFVPKTGEPSMATGLIPREGFERAISDLFGIQKK